MKNSLFIILVLINLVACDSNLTYENINQKARQVREELKRREAKEKMESQEVLNRALTLIPEDEKTVQDRMRRQEELKTKVLKGVLEHSIYNIRENIKNIEASIRERTKGIIR
ncbi:hypothetical protein [Borrelia crocidurae]|uniref:Uncharacterized protein n=1 Tax=Borrelia crocidurae (strain Achema) TaxID=1155096 RepID=I0FE16_BORCA|nr:hypothetical protein [Borrelia crocidurae]AFI31722.1 hypothetical protein Q7M_1014 [Borrelia crocidurae str. Achema]